jgi:O-antigen ligase
MAGALLSQFSEHPWLGTGFGSYVSQNIRSEAAPWSYELVFHSLLMKIGVVGIVMVLVILGMALRVADVRACARANPRRFAIWTAFTTAFWFAGATNPLVTNFAGMSIIVLLLVDMRQWLYRPA